MLFRCLRCMTCIYSCCLDDSDEDDEAAPRKRRRAERAAEGDVEDEEVRRTF